MGLDRGAAGEREKDHLLVFTLGYSRRLYTRGYPNERLATLLDGHERAFGWFGDVTLTCLYDNLGTLMLSRSEIKVLWHPLFEDFARYCRFTPRDCQPYGQEPKASAVTTTLHTFFAGFGEVMVSDLKLYEAVSRSEAGEAR